MKKHLLALAAGASVLTFASVAFAAGNTVYIDSTGNNNNFDVTQAPNGGNNVGTVGTPFQNGSTAASQGNDLTIVQSGTGNNLAVSNTVYPSGQLGSHNKANVEQSGNNNGTASGWDSLFQQGDHNKAKLTESSDANGFRLTQYGSDNDVKANQAGTGGNNYFDSIQYGSNIATLVQKGAGYNTATNLQDGTGNLFDGTQNGYANLIDSRIYGSDSSVTSLQHGDNNQYWVYNVGDGNTASQIQIGDRNRAYAYQTGDGNSALGTQQGHDNYAIVTQGTYLGGGISAPAVTGNLAQYAQQGNFNSLRVSQQGNNNTSVTNQIGNHNTGVVNH